MKNNKGITLIALVVTIIILLILAGVSIAMFTGDGIFSRASLGARAYDEAQKAENSVIEGWIEGYDNAYQGQQVVAPTIEVVGEEKDVYMDGVQLKITVKNPNVLKDAHYMIEGAQAKGDTVIADKGTTTITLSALGVTTVKTWAVGFNGEVQETSKTVTINCEPPAHATITVSGPTNSTSLPQTLRATVTHTSEHNDIVISNCKYTINNSSENLGTDPSSYANTFTSNGQEIEIPINATGNYYLHVLSSNPSTTKVETIKTITVSENKHQHVKNDGTIGTSEYITASGGCYTKKWYSVSKIVETYHAGTAAWTESVPCGGTFTKVIQSGTLWISQDGTRSSQTWFEGAWGRPWEKRQCTKCACVMTVWPQGGNNGLSSCCSQHTAAYHGKKINHPATSAYWSTDSNTTVTGWGDVPANSNNGTTKVTYSNPTYRYYTNCGKTPGTTIDSYTISY